MDVVLKLLFLCIFVRTRSAGQVGDGQARAPCIINLDSKQRPNPSPLFFRNEPGLTFALPKYNNGVRALTVNAGESVVLLCAGSYKTRNGPTTTNGFTTIPGDQAVATCVGGTTFNVNGNDVTFSTLSCQRTVSSVAVKTDNTCDNGFLEAVVGFRSKSGNLPNLDSNLWTMITICHDQSNAATLYEKHILNGGGVLGKDKGSSRPSFREGSFYRQLKTMPVYKAYTPNQQTKTIEKIVGSSNLAGQYVRPQENVFLSRGHLAPDADFCWFQGQDATYWYINAAPQWQVFNGGNWNKLENAVRNYSIYLDQDITVYTGTFDVTELTDVKNDTQDIYLYLDSTPPKLPVPKFFWLEDLRRRRQDMSVELRKQKKDDQLMKRRQVDLSDEPSSPIQEQAHDLQTEQSLADIVSGITSSDPQLQASSTHAARKILSRERNPPIDSLIQSGIVPHLVTFLQRDDMPELQFEAGWALTNIASGTSEQTKTIVAHGAIPSFVRLLSSSHSNVAEQAVWALGNIAGDGATLRDNVLQCKVLPPLLNLIKPDTPIPFLRNVAWTMSNLCRNKDPHPSIQDVKTCLPGLKLLLTFPDKDVLVDTCWALSYLSDGTNERIQMVVDAGVIPRLIELLGSDEPGVVTPSLRCIGNIVTGTDVQTDHVVAYGALPVLAKLLRHNKQNIVKEAAWAISNVTAGNTTQIQAVINAGCLEPLVDVLQKSDFKSQKEAAWAVTNLTMGGTVEQIIILCQTGAVKPICDLLTVQDAKILQVLLDCLENILKTGVKLNELSRVAMMIEECGGLDKIEMLQQHENTTVYEKASGIIQKYFGEEDVEEGLSPAADTEGYVFQSGDAAPQGGFSF